MEIVKIKFTGENLKEVNEFLSKYADEFQVKEKQFLTEKCLCLCIKEVNYQTVNKNDTIVVKDNRAFKLDKYDIEKLKED